MLWFLLFQQSLDRQCRYFKAKVLDDHKADGTDNAFGEKIFDRLVIANITGL